MSLLLLSCALCSRGFVGSEGIEELQPATIPDCAHSLCARCFRLASITQTIGAASSAAAAAASAAASTATAATAASSSSASSSSSSSAPRDLSHPRLLRCPVPSCGVNLGIGVGLDSLQRNDALYDALTYFHSTPELRHVNDARRPGGQECSECAEMASGSGGGANEGAAAAAAEAEGDCSESGAGAGGPSAGVRQAIVYCATDDANYCALHDAAAHSLPSQRRSHRVMPIGEKVGFLQDRHDAESTRPCPLHALPTSWHCSTCSVGACASCAVDSASTHFTHASSLSPLSSLIVDARQRIDTLVASTHASSLSLARDAAALRKQKHDLESSNAYVENLIDSQITDLVRALEKRGALLKEEVARQTVRARASIEGRMIALLGARSAQDVLREESERLGLLPPEEMIRALPHLFDVSAPAAQKAGASYASLPPPPANPPLHFQSHHVSLQQQAEYFGEVAGGESNNVAPPGSSPGEHVGMKYKSLRSSSLGNKMRTIFSMSTILTQAHLPHLLRFFGSKAEMRTTIALLYRASRHGWSSRDFHKLCDKKGPTLLAVRTIASEGTHKGRPFIFGLFNSREWASTGEWIIDESKSSFIFSLENAHGRPVRLGLKKPNFFLWADERLDVGPCVGGKNDIYLGGPDMRNSSECMSQPNSFHLDIECETQAGMDPPSFAYDETLLAGQKYFQADEIEVFSV